MGAFVMTCAERAATLSETLDRLAATDWSSPVEAVLDPATGGRSQTRQEFVALDSLRAFLDGDLDVMLFLEDDVAFATHIEEALLAWRPVREHGGGPLFGSLYDPGVTPLPGDHVADRRDHLFIADPETVYGSQAFVLSRSTAAHLERTWWSVDGGQDIKMSRLAALLGPIHYHRPCLVEHVGARSTWGGPFHTAVDYDPAFVPEPRVRAGSRPG